MGGLVFQSVQISLLVYLDECIIHRRIMPSHRRILSMSNNLLREQPPQYSAVHPVCMQQFLLSVPSISTERDLW